MTYGVLGPSGYMALGKMAQAPSPPPSGLAGLPRTITPSPEVPSDPEKVEARSDAPADSMARMLMERDSNSRGDELSVGSGGSSLGSLPDMISTEPGMMSLMGLSTGSGYDELGRAYDTLNFDAGGAVGGLAGNLLGGPLGGLAGGLLGRQADWNYALGGDRSRDRDFGQGGVGQMSSGERRAFEEAREYVMSRPAPTNLTSTEAGRRAASERFSSDSNTKSVGSPIGSGQRSGGLTKSSPSSPGRSKNR